MNLMSIHEELESGAVILHALTVEFSGSEEIGFTATVSREFFTPKCEVKFQISYDSIADSAIPPETLVCRAINSALNKLEDLDR